MTFPAIDNLPPIHPGEILRDDLEALSLSARRFAEHIGVPPNAVTEILRGERRVTAPMALRIGKAFGTDFLGLIVGIAGHTKAAREQRVTILLRHQIWFAGQE